jgi:gliding motility-associated-like protein
MKKLTLLFVLLSSLISFSQLSNKHWIPPLHSRDNSAISDQYIYMSTNETTPFQVIATDGSGTPYAGSPFTISASTPVSFTIGTGQPTKMFLSLSDVNTVVSGKGVLLQGPKDFYVSFRMRHASHAETIISKGKPGIGTSFRLGCTINESQDNRKNFVASVMATENNTSVTLSNYNTGVIFSSGTGNITADTQTFTLNAGQCVVFSGYSNVTANLTGIIGGLITSDKPVAVNTGNALGGITNGRADLTLDQIVSATQIGTDYIFIEGNGSSAMENPLIVAHEDNTAIFVNGSTAAVTTLNAGQYYLVPNSYYQGINNSNIYVRASKPVFAYQLLGGGSDTATSGLNFIPPLSCFFQNSVNLPNVNQIGSNTYTTDLMMLTYSNAIISINGVAVPTSQAQTVLGNTDWVSYRVSNQSGNLNVTSTGPLAVGVFGFQGTAVGFAGYYSGFGSTPQDTNVSVCSNSTKDLFTVITGNPGTGGTWSVPTGGSPLNGNIFDPAINLPGEYIYTFTKSCNTALTTISVKVIVSIQQIKNPGVSTTTSSCVTTPSYNLFSLLGNTAEVGGTWSPTLTSGTGVFNPAVDAGGIYTYSFPATGVCPVASSTVNVNNSVVPVINTISDYAKCDDAVDGSATNGTATFNLTLKNNEVLGTQTGVNVTYHTSQNDANLGQNGITSINTGNRIIYVRLTMAASGCHLTTSFNLVVNPVQTITTQPLATQDICVDGTVTPFTIAYSGGLGTPSVQWYSNTTNSNTNGTIISGATSTTYTPPTFTSTGDFYYYAVVTYSGLDCGSVASTTALVRVVPDPTVTITPNTQIICQGATPTDLVVTPSGGVGTYSYQWFSSLTNTAIAGATNASYTPPTATVGTLSYYCVITQTGLACSVTSPIASVQVVDVPVVNTQPQATQTVCLNGAPINLAISLLNGTGTPTYQWYSNTVNALGGTSILGATSPSYTPLTTAIGTIYYYCIATYADGGCGSVTSNIVQVIVNPIQTVTPQPLASQDICVGGTIAPLVVGYTDGVGTATYQWFTNPGGLIIAGATSSSYTPGTFGTVGDYIYYATVTLSGSGCGSVASTTALVRVVPDPTVTITPNTQIICQGATPTDLVVTPSGGVGTYSYQWFSSLTNTAIAGATNASYTPPTTTVGTISYYCVITQTGLACSVTSPLVSVQVVNNPSVSLQPLASQPICINNTPVTLTTAFNDGTGTPTYQWYSNTVNSYTGGTLISGETTLSYTPITSVVRTLYYYCIATYANGGCGTVSTNIAEVIVNPLPVINDVTIVQCDDDLDAITAFNLTVNNNQISVDAANETFTYYTSLAGASANPTYDEITNPLSFTNTTPTLMYIWTRVTTVNGCYRVARITLRVAAPNIPSTYNITLPAVCDDFLDINGNNNANNNDRDGVATFNFSSTEPTIRALLPTTGTYFIKYYRNRADALAQLNEITNLTNYRNIGYPSTQNIWVRIDSDILNTCYGLGPWVTLNVQAKPFAHTVTIPRQCDDNTDGIFNFNTANLERDLLLGQTGVAVTYFDASNNPLRDSNNNLITSPFPGTFSSTSQTIRAVVTNTTPQACWFDTTIQFIVDKSPIDYTIPASLTTICDDETDPALQNGQYDFTTSQAIHNIVTLGQPSGMVYEYYDEYNVLMSTPLPNPLPVTLTKNITVVVYNPINPTCRITKTITFTVNPVPVIELESSKLVCSNDPTFFALLDAGITDGTPTTNYTYEWSLDGVVIPTATNYSLNVNTEGIYTVKVINSMGCFRTRTITVIASNAALFNMPTIMDLSDNNTVIINVTGLGNYVFSLDYPNAYQTINIFTDVAPGVHTVYVKDLDGCGTTSQIINVIGIPKFFTPNGDGYNDTWNVLGLTSSKNFNTTIYIFDRYGKLLKELSPISKGWDGTFNGEPLPTDDYWYTIYFEDGRTEKGHFTLKR